MKTKTSKVNRFCMKFLGCLAVTAIAFGLMGSKVHAADAAGIFKDVVFATEQGIPRITDNAFRDDELATYPIPFGYTGAENKYYRNNIMYHSSEFVEKGIESGYITEISFKVTESSIWKAESIKLYLGVANKEQINSVREGDISFTEVWSATGKVFGLNTGWETIRLTTPYLYDTADGNLVVAITTVSSNENGAEASSLQYQLEELTSEDGYFYGFTRWAQSASDASVTSLDNWFGWRGMYVYLYDDWDRLDGFAVRPAIKFTFNTCEHTSTRNVTKPATCEADGYVDTACDICNMYLGREILEATGHDWDEGVITLAAACTAAGEKTFTCQNGCGDSYVELIPATGHTSDGGKTTITATCTRSGEIAHSCTECDEVLYVELVPATGHTFVNGKCTADGCNVEEHKEFAIGEQEDYNFGNDVIPFGLNHKYAATQTIYTAKQMGGSKTIHSLAYYVTRSAIAEADQVTIALGYTDKEAFTYADCNSGLTLDDMTVVYSAEKILVGGTTGWETYDFDTPFEYDASKGNLVVLAVRYSENGIESLPYYMCNTFNGIVNNKETCMFIGSNVKDDIAGACLNNGKYQTTSINQPVIKFGFEADVHLAANSISLNGDIAVNFYYFLSDDVLKDSEAKVVFTLPDGKEQIVPVSEMKLDGKGRYRATCVVAAKQMTDEITAVVNYNGKTTDPFIYTVQNYANAVMESDSLVDLQPLMVAMLNYGTMAQKYFAKDVENLVYANDSLRPAQKVLGDVGDLSGYKRTITKGATNGLNYYATSLLCESETAIRHYFTVGEGHTIDEYSFYCGGTELKPVKKGGQYYVDIADIAAAELDNMYTLTVKCGDKVAWTINYGAFTYAYDIMNNANYSNDTELMDLLKAMYHYNVASKAWFESQTR